MSALERDDTVFEHRARETLQRSVAGTPAHIRSQLNRARQAALAEAGSRSQAWRGWAPAGALAATVLVAMIAWQQLRPGAGTPVPLTESSNAVEVLDLVADNDAIDLADGAIDYAFYEWAAAEQTGAET